MKLTKIDIDIEVLDSISKRTKDAGAKINNTSNIVRNIGSGIESSWRRNYTSSYSGEVDRVALKLRKISEELEALSVATRNYSNKMREIERQNRVILSSGHSGGGGGR